jgi:hypothetical protein
LSNVLTTFSLAGFQVTTIGRFWVTAEAVMSSAVKRTYFPIRRKGMAFLRVRS